MTSAAIEKPSDLPELENSLTQDRSEPKKPYRQILIEEISEGQHELERPPLGLFLSALSAGLDVGFSLFLMAVIKTMVDSQLPEPVTRLLVANMYAVGFIFVVLGRSELFTEHTTLAVLPVLGGQSNLGALARLWGVVYAGNLVGGAIFAALTVLIGPALGVISPQALGDIAHVMYAHSAWTIVVSAMLAAWLMGLLSWLVTASRDTISQIVMVWLIASVIGVASLHHAVVGSVEVLAGVFARQASFADFGHFLLWTTIGNSLGGTVFVALLKYSHATRGEQLRQTKRRRA